MIARSLSKRGGGCRLPALTRVGSSELRRDALCTRPHQQGTTSATIVSCRLSSPEPGLASVQIDIRLCAARTVNARLPGMSTNPAETPDSEKPAKMGTSDDSSREKIDRRISVAPMMDWPYSR